MAELAASGAHAAKALGGEAVDVVVEYLVPLAGGLAGFTMGAGVLGGTMTVANAISSAGAGNITQANANRLAGGLFAVIWGSVGYAFWRMGHRDGWVMKLLGRGFGAFFLGTAANLAIFKLALGQAPNGGGAVDKMISWVQGVAGGTQ